MKNTGFDLNIVVALLLGKHQVNGEKVEYMPLYQESYKISERIISSFINEKDTNKRYLTACLKANNISVDAEFDSIYISLKYLKIQFKDLDMIECLDNKTIIKGITKGIITDKKKNKIQDLEIIRQQRMIEKLKKSNFIIKN